MSRSGGGADIPPQIIRVIKSFLENRSFTVKVDDETSSRRDIAAGVAQGSPLSPILFLLYMNDIPQYTDNNLALFADDAAVITSARQPRHADSRIQKHFVNLEKYFHRWKLKINPDKSEVISFSHT